MKFEFCETCPDKGTEACPLPSRLDRIAGVAVRAGWKSLQYIDAALTGEVEDPYISPHEDRWPHKQSIAAQQRNVDQVQQIADCVSDHTGFSQSASSSRPTRAIE